MGDIKSVLHKIQLLPGRKNSLLKMRVMKCDTVTEEIPHRVGICARCDRLSFINTHSCDKREDSKSNCDLHSSDCWRMVEGDDDVDDTVLLLARQP